MRVAWQPPVQTGQLSETDALPLNPKPLFSPKFGLIVSAQLKTVFTFGLYFSQLSPYICAICFIYLPIYLCILCPRLMLPLNPMSLFSPKFAQIVSGKLKTVFYIRLYFSQFSPYICVNCFICLPIYFCANIASYICQLSETDALPLNPKPLFLHKFGLIVSGQLNPIFYIWLDGLGWIFPSFLHIFALIA